MDRNNAPVRVNQTRATLVSLPRGKIAGMDGVISTLFGEWLSLFEAVHASSANGVMWREDELREIEARLAATPADGWKGLAIKLALHCFMQDHGDTESSIAHSAYLDLVRLSGHDPLGAINEVSKKTALAE